MTKYILPKKVITHAFTQNVYKLFVVLYAVYIAFSANVFALEVEAPLSSNAIEIEMVEETAIQERRLEQVKNEVRAAQAEKIRAYYARHNLPLQHEAEHFVDAAEEYDIDWRLVAAIGMIESTGGKFACQTADYSAFGWGSCKIDFDSYEESIHVISMNLAGHNPKTASFYKDKDLRGILESYNPPHIVADYADKVMREMDKISPAA
tara:strand:- start:1262 stop:1882 length:621 start_codon:yes stop_codon:yes gene_type:complete